jgi:D-alanine-D-alanine ligase
MPRKKINLAVVFYGHKNQSLVNKKQFEDLKNLLVDFRLTKYDFGKEGHVSLLRDFKKRKIDIVLKNSYGRGNEADIESFLELHKIPYLGSDARSTFVGTNKLLSKFIFRLHGLPVAKDIFVDSFLWKHQKSNILRKVDKHLRYPCIIKDVAGTDSRGIFIARGKSSLISIMNGNVRKYMGFLVEEFIEDCQETTCLVVGNERPKAYEPVGFDVGSRGFLSGKIKDNHAVNLEIPLKLPKKIIGRIKETAVNAHLSLGCRIFSRSDILVKKGRLYLLEVDVHPGFRSTSASLISAGQEGESANDFFKKIIKFSK